MPAKRTVFSLAGSSIRSQENYWQIIRLPDEVINGGTWYKMNGCVDLQWHSCHLSPLVSAHRRVTECTTRKSVKY